MDQKIIFLTIIGMALVTYIPRLLPVMWLSSRDIPSFIVSWLRFVPTSVLAAMLFPSLFMVDNKIDITFNNNLFFWVSIPTALIAWKTKSLFGSVLAGMLFIAIIRFLVI